MSLDVPNDTGDVDNSSEEISEISPEYESIDELLDENNPTDVAPEGEPASDNKRELQYQIGSEHDDFELYWDLEHARRRNELQSNAETVPTEPVDAVMSIIDIGTRAHQYNELHEMSDYEAELREWFYSQHGSAPHVETLYTEEVDVPEDFSFEEEPKDDRS